MQKYTVADSSATILSVSSTCDGEWGAACASSGHVYFHSSTTAKNVRGEAFVFNPSCLAAVEVPTTAIAFCPKPPVGLVSSIPEGGYLALTTSSNGYVRQTLVDASKEVAAPSFSSHVRRHKELTSSIESNNEVLAACYDTSGTVFVTGGSDSKLRLYDAESSENISTIQKTIGSRGQDTVGHNGRIFSIKFLDEMCFVSGGWESSMLLHDTRVRKAVRVFEGVHMSGDGIALLGNGVVASASDRSKEQLQFFDIGTAKEVMPRITTPMNLFACDARAAAGDSSAAAGSRGVVLWAVGSQPSGVMSVHVDVRAHKADVINTTVSEGGTTAPFDGALFGVASLADGTALVGGHRGGLYRIASPQ